MLYIVIIVAILAWFIGFFLLDAGESIHILLVLAISLTVFRIFQEDHIY